MATIRLTRKNEPINILRNYRVFIDEQEVGTIANGTTKDFITTADQHIITIKIDWCSSPDMLINVGENEIIYMKVGGFKNNKLLLSLGFSFIALSFILAQFTYFEYALFLVLPMLIGLIYYLTLGRKKYLVLTNVHNT